MLGVWELGLVSGLMEGFEEEVTAGFGGEEKV